MAKIEAIASLLRNIGFILGFREAYKVEYTLTVLGLVAFILSYFVVHDALLTMVVTSIFLLSPAITQYVMYRRGRVPTPTVPTFTVVVSAVVSAIFPPLLFVALINAALIEDVTVFVRFDIVQLKKSVRFLIQPVAHREFLSLVTVSAAAGVLSYVVTRNVLVFLYPLISYILLVYSIIVVPREYRPREAAGRGLLEEFARRIPFLYFIFMRFYNSPSMIRLGNEAGYVGARYHDFVRKVGGLFAFSVYASLAVAPILYVFVGTPGLLLPLLVAPIVSVAPYVVLKVKRSSRASKIARNLLLILSYLAAMKSVAESFTNAFLNLRMNPQLAKLFGMEEESKIYFNIYLASNEIEQVAIKRYADTIPDDLYRDTIRTTSDIEENEGIGAAFRSLVARLKDYTSRYLDKISATFENFTSNVISVLLIVETALPVLMFMSSPSMMPMMMVMGGLLTTVIMYSIATMAFPDLPSEFIHAKPRYRRASVVFAVISAALTLLEYALVPELLTYLVILNVPVAFMVAYWYASLEDLRINADFLNKFPDLLVLFSSFMSRHNSIERALLELSEQTAFTDRMRRVFRNLANVFAVTNIQKLSYRGPYWYKYFVFLASISALYGTTPRELYKTISSFMLEFKRFFNMVTTFTRTILILTIMALFIMTLEVHIAGQFLSAVTYLKLGEAATRWGISMPLPQMAEEEIQQFTTYSYVALLAIAIMNGVALSKVTTGSIRDGRWTLILFLLELLVIYIGKTTSFGIVFTVPSS